MLLHLLLSYLKILAGSKTSLTDVVGEDLVDALDLVDFMEGLVDLVSLEDLVDLVGDHVMLQEYQANEPVDLVDRVCSNLLYGLQFLLLLWVLKEC